MMQNAKIQEIYRNDKHVSNVKLSIESSRVMPRHLNLTEKIISNLKIVVDDIMERRISVYIEENDEKMEQQLITQNVYRIVKINIQLIPFHIKKNDH